MKNLFDKDRRADMLFTAGSQQLKRFPMLDRLLVGDNVIPAGWRHIGASVDDYEGYWIDIPGAEHGSIANSSVIPQRSNVGYQSCTST
ncbi:hypothetical protein H7097_04135 [Aeromicrobium sp.]|nr:hypothetical protein [Candidatus Saccharibacteria bacterium]